MGNHSPCERLPIIGALFETVDAQGADFSNVPISDVLFADNSDFTNANFSNTTLFGVLFENSDFSGADFSNVAFVDFHIDNSNLSNANLTGSDFNSIPAENIVNVDLTGATCPDGLPSAANSCQR